MTTMTSETSPRTTLGAPIPAVWVGCLGCYNGGYLTGFWIDADEAGELQAQTTFRDLLKAEPAVHAAEGHEELWCLDHENFGGWITGECSPAEAARVAAIISAIETDGDDPAAVLIWSENTGAPVTEWDAPTAMAFHDAYLGAYESLGDYAASQWEDQLDTIAEELRYYIDWDGMGRDLELGGQVYTHRDGNQLHIFSSC